MMHILYCISLILIFIINEYIYGQFVLPPNNLDEYDAYGSLLAMNEYLVILAQNDQEQFTIVTYPFVNRSNKCVLPYDTIQHNLISMTRFVYNVAIGAKQNASQLIFAYIDENWRRDVFLTVVSLQFIDTGCVEVVNRIAVNITDLNMEENALVGMDPYGKRAYAIGTYYIVCVDIETGNKWQNDTQILFDNQEKYVNLFFPKSVVITEDHYILIVGQRFNNLKFLPYLFVLDFRLTYNITLLSLVELSDFNFGPSSIDITRYSTMSISFLDTVEQFIIGIPYLDMLIFLSWNYTNSIKEAIILRKYVSSQKGILFGKSVALIDNNTFAVLAHLLPTLPWSTSQVQLYSLYDEDVNNRPLIVYPNNQQIIPSINFVPPPHSILTIISWNSHLGLVLDVGAALLLSTSPPGYFSSPMNSNLSDLDIYVSVPCIPGTARNTTSFGPCFLCPPNTKNNGSSGIDCEPCIINDSLLCLRGSSIEISVENVTNSNQAIPYPDSPELVEFDDIILEHIFSFTRRSSHCFAVLPLFWTILAIGFGLLILILMFILMLFPQWKPHRTLIKRLFRRMDLLGEGELWFGGLLTFSILILIIFTCKFSVDFSHLYPIETISSDSQITDSCNFIAPNAKFTSGLQLLSIGQHDEERRIFTLLDKQNITLTVHFVSTAFPCSSVTMQKHLDREQRIPTTHFNCTYDKDTTILSISVSLIEHLTTLQLNLTGPYFIGGLRLCLSGPSTIEEDGKYILQQLDFCQFYYTDNETLTINPTISVKMTKVINRTVGYTVSDEIIFSGIWIPTLTVSTLSDVLFYDETGEYIRYLSDHITLIIDISESEFFVKNIQQPIARHYEIVLHTILFAIVVFELFGLFFLLIKLIIVPLAELFKRRCLSKKDPSVFNNQKELQLTRVRHISINETSFEDENKQSVNDNNIIVATSF